MQYTKYPRQELSGKRHYITPEGAFPSVTTILSATQTAEKAATLEAWRQRVGEQEAERIRQFSCDAGTVMHETIEMHHDKTIQHDHSIYSQEARELGARMYEVMRDNLKGTGILVHAQEPSFFYTFPDGNGYAGSTDVVGSLNGDLFIGDYKNSRSFKRKEWIRDYILQSAAYAAAHDQMFGTSIKQTRIWLVTHDMRFQQFIVNNWELAPAKQEWFKRCRQYFAQMEKEKAA